jgi:hypothetical protein
MAESLQEENERLSRQLGVAGVYQPPPADMPNARELEELRSMVLSVYPVELTCSLDQLERCIRFLCYARRQPKLNTELGPLHFMDRCKDWLKAQGYKNDVSLRSFIAGCIVMDVGVSPLDHWPFDIEVALGRGDVSTPSNAWRKVLARGKLSPPMPLNRPLYEQSLNMIQPSDPRETGIRIKRE